MNRQFPSYGAYPNFLGFLKEYCFNQKFEEKKICSPCNFLSNGSKVDFFFFFLGNDLKMISKNQKLEGK